MRDTILPLLEYHHNYDEYESRNMFDNYPQLNSRIALSMSLTHLFINTQLAPPCLVKCSTSILTIDEK